MKRKYTVMSAGKFEFSIYKDDEKIWCVAVGLINSQAVMSLHYCSLSGVDFKAKKDCLAFVKKYSAIVGA